MSAILSIFCGLTSAQGTAASSGLWLPCLYLLNGFLSVWLGNMFTLFTKLQAGAGSRLCLGRKQSRALGGSSGGGGHGLGRSATDPSL